METDSLVIRGPDSEVQALRSELETFLKLHDLSAADVGLGSPEPVKRRLTDPAPLGHEAVVQLAIEIGKAVAIGVMTSVLKDVVLDWIKTQVAKRNLRLEPRS